MNDGLRLFLLVFFLAIMLYIAIRLGLGHYSKKHGWKLNFDKHSWKNIFKWKRTKTEYTESVQQTEKKTEPTKEEKETKAKLNTYQEL